MQAPADGGGGGGGGLGGGGRPRELGVREGLVAILSVAVMVLTSVGF